MRLDELTEASEALIAQAVRRDHAGRIAVVSSFGADSVVLLDMVARINPATPVLLNETGMLFRETLAYQRDAAETLGLSNVRLVRPRRADLNRDDPTGTLHATDPDACCSVRKVAPLRRALQPFSAWITGRKRGQSATRAAMPLVERDGDHRVKLNPLAEWTAEDLAAYFARHDLPAHPLVSRGFLSIGCAPCTTPVAAGEDARAGRWRGVAKTECGIHIVDGQIMRAAAQTGA